MNQWARCAESIHITFVEIAAYGMKCTLSRGGPRWHWQRSVRLLRRISIADTAQKFRSTQYQTVSKHAWHASHDTLTIEIRGGFCMFSHQFLAYYKSYNWMTSDLTWASESPVINRLALSMNCMQELSFMFLLALRNYDTAVRCFWCQRDLNYPLPTWDVIIRTTVTAGKLFTWYIYGSFAR